MNLIEKSREFISIDSTPSQGSWEMAQFIGEFCKKLGFCVEYQELIYNGVQECNVLVRPLPNPEGREELLFQTHLDTAEPGHYGLWTDTSGNPFNATIYGDRIVGLGVANVKLDFLCKILAAQKFLNRNFKKPFVLAGTFGEGSGMKGAIQLVKRKKIFAKEAMVGEPTKLRLVDGGVGIAKLEISIPFSNEEKVFRAEHDLKESSSTQSKVFSGQAAHSSASSMGENAIIKMLDYLESLPEGLAVMDLDGGSHYNSVASSAILEIDLEDRFTKSVVPKLIAMNRFFKSMEEEFLKYKYDEYTPSCAALNLGKIRTKDDMVRMEGSVRWPDLLPEDIYLRWMEDLRTKCESVGAVMRILETKPPFGISADNNFLKGCRGIMNELQWVSEPVKISSCTEASIFNRFGLNCIVFGPGEGGENSHAPNEAIDQKDLNKAIEFYEKVIERFCI